MVERKRKLAATMLTDIVGFSKKMGDDEEKALEMLERHNALLTPIIEGFNGSILKYIGDAILAEYPSVVEAVKSALQIQAELKEHNQTLPEEDQIRVKIGIHVGDVVVVNGDIFGDGVNITARLQPLAEPGGVCISSIVHNQIKNMPEFHSISLGTRHLKNIKEPVEILKLVPAQEASWLEHTKSSVVATVVKPRSTKILATLGVLALITVPVLAVLGPFGPSDPLEEAGDPLEERVAVVEEHIRHWEREGWDLARVEELIP